MLIYLLVVSTLFSLLMIVSIKSKYGRVNTIFNMLLAGFGWYFTLNLLLQRA